MADQTLRVGVLFGGPSAEHEVSCASALAMIRALGLRHHTVPIGVTRDRGLRLLPDQPLARLQEQRGDGIPLDDRLEVVGTEVELRRSATPGRAIVVAPDAPHVPLAELDVVFPLLHGPYGEDGEVQALLQALDVPYVGCGILASATGMDKVAMKRSFLAEGIPIAKHVFFNEEQWRTSSDPLGLVATLQYPLFVKPANLGSSIGISRVMDAADLPAAVDEALRHDDFVVVEQGIVGREFECAVLGGFTPQASVVGEVTVSGGWFDYDQKYLADSDPMIVPACVPESVSEKIRQLSVAAYESIGGWGLSRVDFLYDEVADEVYVNEVNTMPGFTAYSMYPKLWAASGIPYDELAEKLLDLAFDRAARRRVRGAAESTR